MKFPDPPRIRVRFSDESAPRTIYHYTSGEGLAGILDKSVIWASSIHQLNDSKEFTYAIDLALDELSRVVRERLPEEAESFRSQMTDIMDRCRSISVYVACFSEEMDSLSQWRGYCPNGFGYNLGFREDVLREMAKKQGFRLEPCIYDESRQREILRVWAEKCVDDLFPRFDVDDIRKVEEVSGPVLEELFEIAPSLKHPSFIEEREWRVFAVVPSDDNRLKLRPGKSMLIRHLDVKLDLSGESELLRDMCVGPTPNPSIAMDALTHYFHLVRVNGCIRSSSVPYRSW